MKTRAGRTPARAKGDESSLADRIGGMAAEDLEVAESFRRALEEAVRTGDRESVFTLLTSDVEWITPRRTLHGLDEMRESWTWGSAPETFEYAFEEGDWVDRGDGRVSCDVDQVYRMKETGDFAYERNRRVELTIRNGKISRYEMTVVG
jgi:ketosteroid isomerase-like protein